jgi:hypothetical protein
MADKIDKVKIWNEYARDATQRYQVPDEIDDVEELTNDMVDVATGYADLMLEELEERIADGTFGGRGSPGRTSRRRRREEPEEPNEPED